jgi:hypothetical protein
MEGGIMPIHLSPEDDAKREERLKNAPQEKKNAEAQKAGADNERDKELAKDGLNKTYQNHWSDIAQSYEDEIFAATGQSLSIDMPPATPWNKSLVNSVVQSVAVMTGPLYKANQASPLRMPELYPAHPASEYCSYTTTTGALGSYEAVADTWNTDAKSYLVDGFNDGSVSESTSESLSASSTSISLGGSVGVGVRLVIRSGGSSAIAITTGPSAPVLPSGNAQPISWVTTLSGQSFAPTGTLPSGSSVRAVLPPFTNAERTSMVSAGYQDILTNAKAGWVAYVTAVKNYIQAQKTAFDANQHDAKDLSYGVLLDNRLAEFASYLTTSLVTDSALSSLQTETINGRITERTTRVSSLPSVLGPIYDKRYTFSNLRGNTIQGSYALYTTYSKGSVIAQGNIDFAASSSTAYET